jgi:N-acetylneuraminic acid mutarotase
VSYTSDGISWSTNAGGAPFGHRQGHATVVFNDRLYLIGGLENDSTIVAPMNDVWVSDDGATWTRVVEHAEWAPRVNMTVVVANNGMYLYGGDFGGGLASDECWFSVDGETWTNLTLAATGTARYVHSMLAYHNKLWIIGGVDGAITPLNDVWSSPDGQTWTLMTAAAFPTTWPPRSTTTICG